MDRWESPLTLVEDLDSTVFEMWLVFWPDQITAVPAVCPGLD